MEQVREGEGGGILCRTEYGREVGMEVDFEGKGRYWETRRPLEKGRENVEEGEQGPLCSCKGSWGIPEVTKVRGVIQMPITLLSRSGLGLFHSTFPISCPKDLCISLYCLEV